MPTLTPVDPARPGAAADTLGAVKARMGAVPNIFATMARAPAVLEGFLAFNGALASGTLDAGLREQIALAVAGENRCDYCASAHTFVAKSNGIDADEAARNLAGEASDPRVAAILGFARAVVRLRGRLPDADGTLTELREAGVTDGEIVEVLAHVAVNLFTNYFNHVAETEIDFPFVAADAAKNAA